MSKVINGAAIDKVYEAFARNGLDLGDTFLVEPYDDETEGCSENVLTFTITGQTARGDWFYGNLPVFESEISDTSAWTFAIEMCCEDYGDLYVHNLETYGYNHASETPLYDEIYSLLDSAKEDISQLDTAA